MSTTFKGGKIMAVCFPPDNLTEEKALHALSDYLKTICKALPNSIGILHLPEPNAQDEEDKRPHIHIYIEGETKNGQAWIKELATLIHAQEVQVSARAIKNPVGALRYLIHFDSPEKIQYKENEVFTQSHDMLTRFRNALSKKPEPEIDEILACETKEQIARLVGVSKYGSALRLWQDIREEQKKPTLDRMHLRWVATQLEEIYNALASMTATPEANKKGYITLQQYDVVLEAVRRTMAYAYQQSVGVTEDEDD